MVILGTVAQLFENITHYHHLRLKCLLYRVTEVLNSLTTKISLLLRKGLLERAFENTAAMVPDTPEEWAEFARNTQIKSGRGYIPFDPYDYQVQIQKLIQENSYVQVVKGRQLGLSETVISVFLHECLQNEGVSALIISKSQLDVYSLAKRVREMIRRYPEEIPLVNDSLSEMRFANGSTLYFRAPMGGRGLPSCQYILFDEFAFYKDGSDEEAWASALPSTEMLDGAERVVIISTPNGKQNLYYQYLVENNGVVDAHQMIEDVREGKRDPFCYWKDTAGWVKAIVHWQAHPVYSKRADYTEWVIKKKKISRSKALREYDLDFSTGETSWLDESLIYACAVGKPESEPTDGYRYYMGVDPAGRNKEKGSGDFFCATVIREAKEPGERNQVVAFHRGRKSGFKRHVSKVTGLAKTFGVERICVETNSMGQLYTEAIADELPDVAIDGVAVTGANRDALLDRIVLYLEDETLAYEPGIYSEELEAMEVKDNGRVEASTGKHDDTVFSMGHALVAMETGPNTHLLSDTDIETF